MPAAPLEFDLGQLNAVPPPAAPPAVSGETEFDLSSLSAAPKAAATDTGSAAALVTQGGPEAPAGATIKQAESKALNAPLNWATKPLVSEPVVRKTLGYALPFMMESPEEMKPSVMPDEQPKTITGGIEKGIASIISGMTTPANLSLFVAGPVFGIASKIVPWLPRVISATFTATMANDLINQYPQIKDSLAKGDYPKAAEQFTEAAGTAGFAGVAAAHALGGPSLLDLHNAEAQRLVEKDVSEGRKEGIPVIGAAPTEVKVGDQTWTIEMPATSETGRQFFQVKDAAGNVKFGGYAPEVQQYLRSQGAAPGPEAPEAPAEPPSRRSLRKVAGEAPTETEAATTAAVTPDLRIGGREFKLLPTKDTGILDLVNAETGEVAFSGNEQQLQDYIDKTNARPIRTFEAAEEPPAIVQRVETGPAPLPEIPAPEPTAPSAPAPAEADREDLAQKVFGSPYGELSDEAKAKIERMAARAAKTTPPVVAPTSPEPEQKPEAEALEIPLESLRATEPSEVPAASEEAAQVTESNTPAKSSIADLLGSATRKYKIGGESIEEPDPRAQLILKSLSPENIQQIDSLMAGAKNPEILSSGFDHVVADLGNGEVMRLGALPKHEADSPLLAKPSVTQTVGDVGVEIYPKLDTSGITQADVKKVQDQLAEQGLTWDDAAPDNLAHDANGDLKIIDGQLKKLPTTETPAVEKPVEQPAPQQGVHEVKKDSSYGDVRQFWDTLKVGDMIKTPQGDLEVTKANAFNMQPIMPIGPAGKWGAVGPGSREVTDVDVKLPDGSVRTFRTSTLHDFATGVAIPEAPIQKPAPEAKPASDILAVTGKTYQIRNAIKQLGGKWDKENAFWTIPNTPTAINAVKSLPQKGLDVRALTDEERGKRGEKATAPVRPVVPKTRPEVAAAPEQAVTSPEAAQTETKKASEVSPTAEVQANEPEAGQPVRSEDHGALEGQLPEGNQGAPAIEPVTSSGSESSIPGQPSERASAGEGAELESGGGTISGVVGDPAKPERTFPPRAQDVVSTHHDRDYRIPDGRVISGSPETRARNNIAAIQLLREIQSQNRPATVQEQEILAGYVGWGAVPQLFAASTPTFRTLQDQLRGLLSDEEYEDAQRSTTNAHYTGDTVVDAMWNAIQRLGAQPGMSWLEPAVGVGNFFGRQPETLLEGARRIGLDKDSVSGQIAKLLYPDSGIDVVAFEDAELPKDYFDGAISNVPFGNFGVHDAAFKGKQYLTSSIHNYFFAKSLTLVRPGGIVAFVTSRYTMDAYAPTAISFRRWVAEQADFLGAVRLPSGAFRQNAGTDVITDVIFLRRRIPGAPAEGESWRDSLEKSLPGQWGRTERIAVNEYFHKHPEMILGEEATGRGQFSANDYDVKGTLTPEALTEAIGRLPENAFQEYKAAKPKRAVAAREIPAAEKSKLGGLFFDERGQLFRKTSKGSVEPIEANDNLKGRIKGQLAVRDALTKLLDAELADKAEATLVALRKDLNGKYDSFTKRYGYLSSQANAAAMKGDPDAPLLVSLERRYNKGNKAQGIEPTAEKAPIFSRRMLQRPEVPTSVGDPKEALSISLNEKGRIDWDRMSGLTGKAPSELQRDLAGLVYKDPTTKIWQTAEEYLSGSVRTKLKQARAIAKVDPSVQPNVEALEKVQPEDILPGQIRALLGVTWVPISDYGQFATELLGADRPVTVKYVAGEWNVDIGWGNRLNNSQKWNTARVGAVQLLQDSLNLRRTKVSDREANGSVTPNPTETKAARARQMEMQDAFEKWLFADPSRADRLVKIYNETQNDLRLRTYDGSHLTLPGMTRDAAVLRVGDLDPHQKNAVWRQIVQPNVLLAHAVGAGKTNEMISAGMELKRLGLVQRPMYVVPNATLTSWQDQFAALYPKARVIVFSEKDLEKSARQQAMARMATGDWDAVVVPESSFQFIPTGDEIFDQHFNKLSAELQEQIAEAQAAGFDTRQIKRMEKAKERLLTSLKDRRNAEKKDQTIFWEQLGIDQLFVDEAHHFKKLGFATKQGNVAGIDSQGNQKTFDLLMKMRYTQGHGRGIVFATGTPVTNTMGELYSLMRYLIEPELEARGIGKFDEWAANFGRTVDVFEPKAEGGGYQLKARFAQFVNIPELATLLRSFADVVTSDMLKIPRPEIIGGKRQAIEQQLSPEQEDYLEGLRERAKKIRDDPRGSLPDNMLSVYGDAAKMALDIRMVRPSASDHPNSRLNMAADRVYEIWKDTKDKRGAQVIFSDLGKPAEAGGSKDFSAYDELVHKLVERGIPRDEIAHVYQAKNKNQRAKLFQDVNDGKIRILLASTEKAGVGVNIQQKLVALHHLDVPHRPSDLEQREGRILRQGNENPSVFIYYYVTKGSLDEAKFANVVRKAKFINQVMQGKSEVREAEDVGGMVPSLEMFQAMASGDPRVMRKLEVDAEVDRLGSVFSGWKNQQYKIRSDLAQIPGRIKYSQAKIASIQRDQKVRDAAGPSWEVEGKRITGDKISKDANEALQKAVQKIVSANDIVEDKPIGSAYGLPMTVKYVPAIGILHINVGDNADVMLGSADLDAIKTIDIFRRLTNQIDGLDSQVAAQHNTIERIRADENNLRAAVQEDWPYAQQFRDLVEQQKRLATELGANKGDEAAEAASEGEEIKDASVEAQEPEEGEEEQNEPEEGAEKAQVFAPEVEAVRVETPGEVKIKGLEPLDTLRTPQVRSVWEGNIANPDSEILSDGHIAIKRNAIKSKAAAFTEKQRGGVQTSTIAKVFDEAVGKAANVLHPLGWKNLGENKKAMLYGDDQGRTYAVQADYAKLLKNVTGATEVRGEQPERPMVFYADAKPVAITAGFRVAEDKLPSAAEVKKALPSKAAIATAPAATKGIKVTPEIERRRKFYTPGNIIHVSYWNQYDKVIDYKEKPDGLWSVTVQQVDKDGSPIPGERPRTHSTEPAKADKIVSPKAASAGGSVYYGSGLGSLQALYDQLEPKLKDWWEAQENPFSPKGPRDKVSAESALASLILPGRGLAQLEEAAPTAHVQVIKAAAYGARVAVSLRVGISKMDRELEGTGLTHQDLFRAYQQSRLDSIRDMWYELEQKAQDATDDELTEEYKGNAPNFLHALENKKGIPQDPSLTAASLVERKDFPTLRLFLGQTFADAGDLVHDVLSEDEFNHLRDEIENNPAVAKAHDTYRQIIEKPMQSDHLSNDGILSTRLGPLDTYFPLIALGHEAGIKPSRLIPFRKPRNPFQQMATGLASQGYTVETPELRDRLIAGYAANSRAAALQALYDSGVLTPAPHGERPETVMLHGVEYLSAMVPVAPPRVLIQNGKVVHTPAQWAYGPKPLIDELRPLFESRSATPQNIIRSAINSFNRLALTGPALAVIDSANIFGTLVSNTPYLGDSLTDKAMSLPLIKRIGAMLAAARTDPLTDEAARDLLEMADLAALPEKTMSVTWSKRLADVTGAKLAKWYDFSPLLYGPKGLDIRARLRMYRIAKAAWPNATPAELHHYVNRIGSYTSALQSRIERSLKSSGLGPFYTRGATMMLNGLDAFVGRSGMSAATGGPPLKRLTTRALLMGAGAVAFVALWAVINEWNTGKNPLDDRESRLGYLELTPQQAERLRATGWGKSLIGTKAGKVYFPLYWFNPVAFRGMRGMGIPAAYDAWVEGGRGWQATERAVAQSVDALSSPAIGPSLRAAWVLGTGTEPNLTDLRDREGHVGPQFFPAINPKLKGWESFEAKGMAATLSSNALLNAYGEATGFLGPERRNEGNMWLKMSIGAAGLPYPSVSNPYAKETILREQRTGTR